jgi:hypothetical protein
MYVSSRGWTLFDPARELHVYRRFDAPPNDVEAAHDGGHRLAPADASWEVRDWYTHSARTLLEIYEAIGGRDHYSTGPITDISAAIVHRLETAFRDGELIATARDHAPAPAALSVTEEPAWLGPQDSGESIGLGPDSRTRA